MGLFVWWLWKALCQCAKALATFRTPGAGSIYKGADYATDICKKHCAGKPVMALHT